MASYETHTYIYIYTYTYIYTVTVLQGGLRLKVIGWRLVKMWHPTRLIEIWHPTRLIYTYT